MTLNLTRDSRTYAKLSFAQSTFSGLGVKLKLLLLLAVLSVHTACLAEEIPKRDASAFANVEALDRDESGAASEDAGVDGDSQMEAYEFGRYHAMQSKKLKSARLLMATLGRQEHWLVRDICIDLLEQYRATPRLYQNVKAPHALAFLRPDLVRVSTNNICTIFLQKGIGKGYGLEVRRVEQEWRLYTFDHYQSWERVEIPLR